MSIPKWLENGAKRFGGRRFFPEERQIHVTELLKPAHMVRLTDRHQAQITQDPMSLIPAMVGVAFHEFVEALDTDGISEEGHQAVIAGWTLLGTPDWYSAKTATLRDYKTTKVWSYVFGKREWEEQLNVYRWLLMTSAGIDIQNLEIHAVLLDWSKNMVARNEEMPRQRMEVIQVQPWPLQDTEHFIRGRLSAIEQWDSMCSPEERWERGEHWAVMKQGRKSALKRCSTQIEAQELADGPGLYVEHRPGVPSRCQGWCSVREFCPFGRNLGPGE